MAITLDQLIIEQKDQLVDLIVKDAIRQIPNYGDSPVTTTLARVENWLRTVAISIQQNDPRILAGYLMNVSEEHQSEGYAIGELHAIVGITEAHLQNTILQIVSSEVEQNGLLALLQAVMGAARMTISVRYVLGGGDNIPD